MCEFCSINNHLKILDTNEFRGYECLGCQKRFELGYFGSPKQELSQSAQLQEFLSCPRGGCSK
jgi:hypothetical protein